MNKAQLHRGPDSNNIRILTKNGKTIYLGNSRLRITDPFPHSDQPFSTPDKSKCITFNGEIYNHTKLRSLKDAHSYQGQSDTETLLYGLVEKGINFLKELNGIFSFAFYDWEKDLLLLARDPTGVKPLYYYEDENFFIAASEIGGILSSGLVKKELNEKQLLPYLLYKYPKRPETFYKNIYEVEPGTSLLYSGNTRSFYSYYERIKPVSSERKNIVSTIESLLSNAVQQQLPSAVKTGLLLSGGIDSTLLLAIINELGIKSFPTFSIFSNETINEKTDRYYAEKAVKQYESDHTTINFDIQAIQLFEDYLRHIDQPVADSASFLTWLVTAKAKNTVKVLLSGAGADELFAGYNRHSAFNNFLSIAPLGTPLMKKLAIFPENQESRFKERFRHLNKFFSSIDQSPAKTWDNFITTNTFNTSFLTGNTISVHNPTVFKSHQYLDEALEHDRNQYLVSDVLKITDHFSMRNSIEVRVPYLDLDLLTYATSLSGHLLLKNGQKWILKEILNKKGGKLYTTRKKEGFGIQLGKLLSAKEGEVMLKRLKNRAGMIFTYVSHERVEELINQHLSGKKDNGQELFALIILASWLEKEFN